MIRAGIATWLAVLGAAGALCLPMPTGVPEVVPRQTRAAVQYPVRIPLPPFGSNGALTGARSSDPLQEAEAVDGPPAEASGASRGTGLGEAKLARPQLEPRLAESGARSNVLLNLNFDLGDPSTADLDNSATADLEVLKNVRVNGTDVGKASIRVTSGATLLVARDQIVSLLNTAGHADIAKILMAGPSAEPFISFEEMRRRGVKLRYEASADRISLSV